MLVSVGALVYANSLNGPFIYDDQLSIVENASLGNLSDLRAVLTPERELPVAGRPIVNLTFALDYARGGLAPGPYHQTNVVVHLLCALVLFGLVRRTLESPRVRFDQRRAGWLAFASALVWMVHPLQTEAVAYLTERTESMMALCYLLTLYAGARAASGGGWLWMPAAVAACAAGMGCKETMATAPVMVAVYDRVFFYRSMREATAARWKFYAALAACWVPLALLLRAGPRIRSAGFASGVSPWTYLLNQAVMVTQYFRLFVWPRSLVFDYGVPRALSLGDVLPYAAFVATLLVGTLVALARRPALGFVGIWCFAILAPTSSFIPIATEVGAERRMYLPTAALVPLVVVLVFLAWQAAVARSGLGDRWRRGLGAAAFALACLLLSAETVRRNAEYQSGVTLARTVLERWPHPRAHHLLGVELLAAGRGDEALAELREAARGDPRAHYTLGQTLYKRGALDEAILELERFAAEQPLLLEVVDARMTIGEALMRLHRPAEAAPQFAGALQMSPRLVHARRRLADAEFEARRFEEAARHYREYLAQVPNDATALGNCGVALAAIGREHEALPLFRRAAEADPRSGAARRNLANALLSTNAFAEAESEARKAVALSPDDAVVRDILGLALASQGRIAEAVEAFQDAVRLDPADEEARAHLAAARARRTAR